MTPRPLDGVRILDLTRVIAGPHSTRMLADLGAEVIKLEPPSGDQTRASGQLGGTSSTGFVQLNAGKRLISVDLDQPDGPGLVRRLAGRVDVLMENFRPGVMANWDLAYDALAVDNPGLIYVSISGYGQTGDWRHRRAYAPFVHAEAGYLSTVADLRRGELQHDPMSVADVVAAKDATIALLAALRHRDLTGAGQHIDISLAHSILFMNEFASSLLTPGTPAPKSGSTPQTIFTTADGQAFSAGNPVSGQIFATLCHAFDCPELIDDPRFVDSGARRARREELVAELQQAVLRIGDADAVERALTARGVVVGRVRDVATVADTGWAIEREAVIAVADPSGRDVHMPSVPWRFSLTTSTGPVHPVGAVGQDNDAVLRDLLGLDDTELGRLRDTGVIRDGEAP
jgi:CoA:oxalate CoA-transferase